MSHGSATPDHGQATLARGASIGRYVVLGLVGRGGMGEVYAAYDPELDRKVAVKLLRVKPGAGVSLTEGRQRTLREAQAIARLSHPNVVVVYDVGTFEEKVFIAMEFVEGNTAGFWAQSQTRDWEDTLKVYRAAGRGLAAAHEKGLVHRDFKPDNVMVSRDGQVRVMDFGLARQAEKSVAKVVVVNGGAGGGGDSVVTTQRLPAPMAEPRAPNLEASNAAMFEARLTRTGAMMGTPAYMAPEQFRGHMADARTDQFAFCVALYEALYGERPFAGNTLSALTGNVLNGRIREAPPATKVPLWVRKILLRGLRVQADERWPSMDDLLDALGKNPVVAMKRRLAVACGSALAVGAVVSIAHNIADAKPVCGGGPERLAGIWELVEPGAPETPRQAQLHQAFLKTGKSYAKDVWATTSHSLTNYARAWVGMYKEACESAVVNKVQSPETMDLRMDCLNERLGGLRALTNVFGEATGEVVENAVSASNALASLDRCADVPVLRAVVKPPETGATKAKVADLRGKASALKARFDAGKWKEALTDAPPVLAEARALGYQPLAAEVLLLMGTIWYKSNNTRDAEDALVQAYQLADDLVWVVGYQDGRVGEAKRWANLATSVLHRLGGHELLQAWLLNDVGAVSGFTGDMREMLRAQVDARMLKEKALGSTHPDVGFSDGNIAFALKELGRFEEALAYNDRSVAILRKGLGPGHPEYAMALSNRGEILNALGRYSDARHEFENAREIWERELGANDRYLGYALTGLGVSYLAEGKPAEARIPLERALQIREASEKEVQRRAETSFVLARALWESGRDKRRARGLAETAKQGYSKASDKAKLREVETWLRSHTAS